MNICIVSNFKQGGYGESTRPGQMAKYLKAFGHNVLHVCDWEGSKEGIKHLKIEREKWERNPVKRIWSFFNSYHAITLFKPDLIYAHQFNNAKWALQTKLFAGKKIIFDAHTSKYFEHLHFTDDHALQMLLKEQEIAMCKSANFIIAASEETKDFFVATYNIDPAKIEVVGNATDIAPVDETYHPINKKFVCLSTLPQDGFKANEMALEMLQQIAEKVYSLNPEIEFHVIGGGKMPAPATPNVYFKGYVADLRRTILDANVCLMPFPADAVCGGARNKFCDYIALGKVVITTPEGLRGMEILRDEQNCLVALDVHGFVSAITNLVSHNDEIKAIESNVFSIRKYFNWQDRAKKVELIFNKLLKA